MSLAVYLFLQVNSTRLQSISGCIFDQLNQAPPWCFDLVALIDGEYKIYAVFSGPFERQMMLFMR